MNKLKVLLLATNNNKQEGHAFSQLSKFNTEKFEPKLITQQELDLIYPEKGFFRQLYRRGKEFLRRIIKYQCTRINKGDSIYSIFYFHYSKYTANQILSIYNDIPDIIILYWYDHFITTKTIFDLYKTTNALIIFAFVDQYSLTGLCHYVYTCNGFITGCNVCPGIKGNSKMPRILFNERVSILEKIPKAIIATPADCTIAKQSPIFKESKMFEWINIPQIPDINRYKTRSDLGLKEDELVFTFTASYICERRKGFFILKNSLERFINMKLNRKITIIVVGEGDSTITSDNKNIRIIKYLRQNINQFCHIITASDFLICPSIADSGPMIINYSITCGTPVICNNIGIAQTLVQHSITGLIIPKEDPTELLKILIEVSRLSNNEITKYRNNCKKLIAQKKQAISVYEQLYDYYRRIRSNTTN